MALAENVSTLLIYGEHLLLQSGTSEEEEGNLEDNDGLMSLRRRGKAVKREESSVAWMNLQKSGSSRESYKCLKLPSNFLRGETEENAN